MQTDFTIPENVFGFTPLCSTNTREDDGDDGEEAWGRGEETGGRKRGEVKWEGGEGGR